MYRTLSLILALLLCSLSSPSWAADSDQVLRVGTKVAPPFAMKDSNDRWHGISIDLWKELARDQGWRYEFVETDLKSLIQQAHEGTLDASIAAITISRPREELVDFSHAYYTTGFAIALPAEAGSRWTNLLKALFSVQFLQVILSLSALLGVFGLLVWFFERRRNAAQFGGNPIEGIGSGFWWAAVTMTTVGYGDKSPVTLGGRLVALVWMFAAIILISSVTAAITTSLTVSELSTSVQGPQDLSRVRVATVEGSSSESYLINTRGQIKGYKTLRAALEGMLAGDADAVLYDAPILKYEINSGLSDQITLLPEEFEQQAYGIALPPESPLREPINRSLLTLTDNLQWKEIQYRYLGSP